MSEDMVCEKCGVLYWSEGACPSCGGNGRQAKGLPPQPRLGQGALCRTCRLSGECPPAAVFVQFSGGTADDECCTHFQEEAAR